MPNNLSVSGSLHLTATVVCFYIEVFISGISVTVYFDLIRLSWVNLMDGVDLTLSSVCTNPGWIGASTFSLSSFNKAHGTLGKGPWMFGIGLRQQMDLEMRSVYSLAYVYNHIDMLSYNDVCIIICISYLYTKSMSTRPARLNFRRHTHNIISGHGNPLVF